MRFIFTRQFIVKYYSLSKEIQNKTNKQLTYLIQNLHHPSLRTKKYDEKRGIWQARVNRNYRFYFLIKRDAYILLEVKPHPK